MIYSVYHPEGFYMCDVEIREEDSSFNKAQINDPESEVYNSKLPKWVKRPTQRAPDLPKWERCNECWGPDGQPHNPGCPHKSASG